MKDYDGYLIDLDGTMYRGEERIDAAVDFVKRLWHDHLPYMFVTNNASKTREQVARKLQSYDIPATKDNVLTSGIAAANDLATKPDRRVYIIGEKGLVEPIREKGMTVDEQSPDVVVIGMDRGLTYEKLATGCRAIQHGAAFISTNADSAVPSESGLLPGNGSLTAVLTAVTGENPKFIGKPEPVMIEQALSSLGTQKARTLMVGDNYETDILAGIRAGIDTLLVHTGVTSPDGLRHYEIQPTYSLNSLAGWLT